LFGEAGCGMAPTSSAGAGPVSCTNSNGSIHSVDLSKEHGRMSSDNRVRMDLYRNRFRIARFRLFSELVDSVALSGRTCTILDVGGTPEYWLALREFWEERDLRILVLNLVKLPSEHPKIETVVGNACELAEYGDHSFDIVHSNSVIEHVGGWQEQKRMAAETRRVGRSYFVQTPFMWFPLEPHYRTLFIHWLPAQVRAAWIRRMKLGYIKKAADLEQAMSEVNGLQLLDREQMRSLFPDATIRSEKVGPLTKSLVAVKRSQP
jgi:hypothetical protein